MALEKRMEDYIFTEFFGCVLDDLYFFSVRLNGLAQRNITDSAV